YNQVLEIYTRDAFPLDWAHTQINLGLAYWNRIEAERAENIETAIAAYNQVLEIYTRDAFPLEWANIQNNLGLAYRNRIKGERVENIELAIAAYNQALEIYTRDTFPLDWAFTQNNLGLVYFNRIKGEKAENLELAIAAYNQALEIYTRDAFPLDWAFTQNNLGNAYLLKGEKVENLELAIAAYNQALEIYTRDAFPLDWARTQNNLGNAHLYRIKGEKAENLEQAIAAYNQALEIYTRDAFPLDWAFTQNNLGNAYLLKGEKAENLEQAIAAYNQALEIYTRDAFPLDWAFTQNNLGNAYWNRIKGERAENLETAIAAYNQALEIYTRDAFPIDWARAQNNLGNAHLYRIKGERAKNLELAIAACNQALEIYTRDAFPLDWARTQNNLGLAYWNRIKGEKAENLELAIAAYNQALEIYTRDAFPLDWARTQNNLGLAYWNRIKGEKAENIELAIAAYNQALKIYTRHAFPEYWARTQNNLGTAYFDLKQFDIAIECLKLALEIGTPTANPIDCLQLGRNLGKIASMIDRWCEAIFGYDKAIQAVEQSSFWASREKTRQALRADAIDVYNQIVQACINNNQIDKAIEYVERSKARTLVEFLAARHFYPKGDIPQQLLEQLQRLKREITPKQQLLESLNDSDENKTIDTKSQVTQKGLSLSSDYVKRLRLELDELQLELEQVLNQIKRFDPSYQLTQKVQPISFPEIRATVDNHTATIAWYITDDCFFTFIITSDNQPLFWQSSRDDLKELQEWRDEYLNDYKALKDKQTQTWKTDFTKLQKLSSILDLDKILSHLPNHCNQLILIPHRYLHLFPVHALPLQTHECLLDRFSSGVRYAPSHQLLQLSQNIASQQTSSVNSFFAIQNPTLDLDYTEIEVEAIHHRFDPKLKLILAQHQATKNAVYQSSNFFDAEYLHFSCHGSFHAPAPLLSHLSLAESVVASNSSTKQTAETTRYLPWRDSKYVDLEKCLTLSDIFALHLKRCHLVTLSACETGLTDWRTLTDEYIGLASGFLVAGSPSIVSSLWAVSDISTCFLMIKFYQNMQTESTIAKALNNAQRWLRDVTKEELQQWALGLNLRASLRLTIESLWYTDFFKDNEVSYKPFHSPEYWAAFCAIGHDGSIHYQVR
uniref:CHAT domain-containing tetratricopeptide repeat protein n=1 Tax=uncultured Nostoc sp. TaxID=340711 RepID=UPI0035C9E925